VGKEKGREATGSSPIVDISKQKNTPNLERGETQQGNGGKELGVGPELLGKFED